MIEIIVMIYFVFALFYMNKTDADLAKRHKEIADKLEEL